MAAISSINRRAFLAALVAACGLPKLAGSLQPAEPECEWCFKMFGPKLAALRPPEPELWRPCISHDELGQYVNHAVNNARREREKAAKLVA